MRETELSGKHVREPAQQYPLAPQTPAAHPGHFDDPRTSNDMASFDPEGAAEAGTSDLRLGYTCVRVQSGER
ncbi:hypothetical protein DYGSA30_34190 [Dyella sp. GSA-30]|nr:hypothetical protein DYGSA30_34190 [Dyella sp. GSA-30]